MSPRPLCHLIPINVYEEAWPYIQRAAEIEYDGNVSEYIRTLILRDLKTKELINEEHIYLWTLL